MFFCITFEFALLRELTKAFFPNLVVVVVVVHIFFLVARRTKKMPGLMLYLHLPSMTANKKCFTAKTHLHQAVYILCELWSEDIFSEHYD